jgi:hypothetical protein
MVWQCESERMRDAVIALTDRNHKVTQEFRKSFTDGSGHFGYKNSVSMNSLFHWASNRAKQDQYFSSAAESDRATDFSVHKKFNSMQFHILRGVHPWLMPVWSVQGVRKNRHADQRDHFRVSLWSCGVLQWAAFCEQFFNNHDQFSWWSVISVFSHVSVSRTSSRAKIESTRREQSRQQHWIVIAPRYAQPDEPWVQKSK